MLKPVAVLLVLMASCLTIISNLGGHDEGGQPVNGDVPADVPIPEEEPAAPAYDPDDGAEE